MGQRFGNRALNRVRSFGAPDGAASWRRTNLSNRLAIPFGDVGADPCTAQTSKEIPLGIEVRDEHPIEPTTRGPNRQYVSEKIRATTTSNSRDGDKMGCENVDVVLVCANVRIGGSHFLESSSRTAWYE